MDDTAVIWLRRTDRIQVDAARDHLSAIVIRMVAYDLRPAGRRKEFSLIMPILLLKILRQCTQALRALCTLSIHLFQSLTAWDIHFLFLLVFHFFSLLYIKMF